MHQACSHPNIPLLFFLCRFVRDQSLLDTRLAETANEMLVSLMRLLSLALLIVWVMPLALFVVVPGALWFYLVQRCSCCFFHVFSPCGFPL